MTKVRQCGDCTACCEGWHMGSVLGYDMFPGRPCQFLCNGCTIYEDRPKDPCIDYSCDWLRQDVFPEWMRPDISKVIITTREWQDGLYYEFRETDAIISSQVLAWIYEFGAKQNHNMRVMINNHWHNYGSVEFCNAVSNTSVAQR
jgi:hypothetical protein